jgi:hypothetical protein
MKIFLNNIMVVIFFVFIGFSLVSCGDGSENQNSNENNENNNNNGNNNEVNNINVIGTWSGQGYIYVFTENEYTLDKGSGIIEEKGTYNVNGNIVSMQSTHTDDISGVGGVLTPDTSSQRIGTVTGNSMAISYPQMPGIVSHTVQKQ